MTTETFLNENWRNVSFEADRRIVFGSDTCQRER
jgi:hypothetical protein